MFFQKTFKMFCLFVFIAICEGICSTANYNVYNVFGDRVGGDPVSWGGANCTNNFKCNSLNNGGECDFSAGSSGNCVCKPAWGNPDCSYQRQSVYAPGIVQIVLSVFAMPGIGNVMIGRTSEGAGQIVLGCLVWISLILSCVAICVYACGSESCGKVCGLIVIILMIICYIGGMIWGVIDGAFIMQCSFLDTNGYFMFK